MSTYQFAQDFDQSGSLADIDPQPRSDGIQFADEIFVTGGGAYDEGTAFFEWIYTEPPYEIIGTLLSTMGFTLSVSTPIKHVECTVKTNLGGAKTSFVTVNAIVIRPELRQLKPGFYRDVVFRFTDVEPV